MMQFQDNQLADQWFLSNEQSFKGPFTEDQIGHMIINGQIQVTDRLWSKTQSDWISVQQIERFSNIHAASISKTSQKLNFNSDWNNSDEFWNYIQSRHKDLNNQSISQSLEVSKPYRPISKGRAISAGFLVSAIIGLIVFQKLGSTHQNINLSLKENQKATEVISQSYDKVGARFELFQNSKTQIVVATNLDDHSEIQVVLEGLPDTLVGNFQINFQKKVVVENGFFNIQIASAEATKMFSEGEYSLKFFCLQCNSKNQDKNLALFDQKIFLGTAKDESYDIRLSQYHVKLREKAKDELQEFNQFSEALISQTQALLVDRWDLNAQQQWLTRQSSWSALQNQISDEIAQLMQSKLAGTVYYAELVVSLSKANQDLRKLEKNFIDSMKSQTNADRVAQRQMLTEQGRLIITGLNTIKQRVSYFMNRPLTSSGMPRNK